MKLLLDQGLPRSTVRHLASMGIAAEHVGDLGLARAADVHILDVARERQAVVVTLDADFHAIMATSHATSPSVVRIRIEGLKGEQFGIASRAGVDYRRCRNRSWGRRVCHRASDSRPAASGWPIATTCGIMACWYHELCLDYHESSRLFRARFLNGRASG